MNDEMQQDATAQAEAEAPAAAEEAAVEEAPAEAETTEEAPAEAAVAEEEQAEPVAENDALPVMIADAEVVNGEARGDHDGKTGSYTATTVVGEEVQIVEKRYIGQLPILVTDQGAYYVAPSDGSLAIEPYNPEKHGGSKEEMTDEEPTSTVAEDDEGGVTDEPIG